jgi:hypothetical protein
MQGLRAQRRRTPAQGALASQAFRLGNKWAGWGLIPILFPLAWQVARVSSYARRPFPSKETRRILERDDPGPPVVPGGQGIGLGERVGDGGGPETVCALLCVAERRATRPNGEWGYSTRRHMLGHERPEAVSPGRGVVLTDLQTSV